MYIALFTGGNNTKNNLEKEALAFLQSIDRTALWDDELVDFNSMIFHNIDRINKANNRCNALNRYIGKSFSNDNDWKLVYNFGRIDIIHVTKVFDKIIEANELSN